ncbi:hypothetical protein [Roseovarius sp.]|uniref:hypothetical protein n=1 Tax=Roseovarius sp. TaxID=1486281 RepID=UPI0026177187|nr:hypothetical protein [Roseovarius sp.]
MKLRKTILAWTTAIVVAPASAVAFVWPSFNPSEFPEISVAIYDSARDGCWTNIGEAERYASDLLSRKGFILVDRGKKVGVPSFNISVMALRVANGSCFGHIRVDLAMIGFMTDKPYIGVTGIYGDRDYLVGRPQNLNNDVLEQIRLLVKEIMRP